MDQQEYRKSAWGLTFLYPLAAFLVFLAAQSPGVPQYFKRDWPFIVGGPVGAIVWWLVATTWRSWPSFFGGYLLGAIVCAIIVAVLEWIAAMINKQWD